jgi:hypothetical protein
VIRPILKAHLKVDVGLLDLRDKPEVDICEVSENRSD